MSNFKDVDRKWYLVLFEKSRGIFVHTDEIIKVLIICVLPESSFPTNMITFRMVNFSNGRFNFFSQSTP